MCAKPYEEFNDAIVSHMIFLCVLQCNMWTSLMSFCRA